MLARVEPCTTPQKTYPVASWVLRMLFFAKRAVDHLRFMDFSIISGRTGYRGNEPGLGALSYNNDPTDPSVQNSVVIDSPLPHTGSSAQVLVPH